MSRSARSRRLLLLAAVVLLVGSLAPVAQAQGPRVLLAEIADAIDRSTVDYIAEAVDEAESGGYAALVVRFDTPGGGLAETEAIAGLFLRTDVPVLGWVGEAGAHAWSAGTILLESTDIAAMAPGTTIGSVQPVVIGPGGIEPVTDEKIVNAVVESLRVKMALHLVPDRNESLARAFVVDNLNLNATDAVRLGATEYVAASVPDFLRRADGARVVLEEGGIRLKDLSVSVADAEIVRFSPSIRVSFLGILSDPLVASLLLVLGVYTLVFGLSAPGHGAEIAGVLFLLLALIGLGFTVDPIALLLIVLGVILLVIELKTPGLGAFGIGGIVSIVLGAVFLAPLRPPAFVVAPEYQIFFLVALITPTASFGGFLLFALYKVFEIRRRKPTIGAMVGDPAIAVDPIPAGTKGYVRYRGELWQAIPLEDLSVDDSVYIHAVEGILLRVSKLPPPASAAPTWRGRLRSILAR